jgi:hypothetical protein
MTTPTCVRVRAKSAHPLRLLGLLGAVLLLMLVSSAAAFADPGYPIAAAPIPSASPSAATPYVGAPATAHSVSASAIPANPWMAPAPWNNAHNDTFMSDTYAVAGPLGASPQVFSTWLGQGAANGIGFVAMAGFDPAGNIITPVVRGTVGSLYCTVTLTLVDAKTLAVLAEYPMPGYMRQSLLDRLPGCYFYLDNEGLAVIGTTDDTIQYVSHQQTPGGWQFSKVAETDLAGYIPEGDAIEALQPDFKGHIWVTTKGGVVITVDATTHQYLGVNTTAKLLSERIVNGTAAGKDGGIYVGSTAALYRFDADRFGRPAVTWRAFYGEGDRLKPGQVDLGTGTTPTLMGGKYVAVTDNADPYMHVLVYRCAKQVSGKRLVAKVPVFGAYQASNENSLVCTDHSIVVENNYGYVSPFQDVIGGLTTTPGLARIDRREDGTWATVWTNKKLSIPSTVTKLCVKNGLIYTYSKPEKADGTDAWYFTAVDYRTGKVVWKQLAGTGVLYDNDYAPTYIGPDGTFYVGVNGGIVALRDSD